MTGDAELIRKLICCAWDAAPDTLELSLYDCLELYARLLAAENAEATHTPAAAEPEPDGLPAFEPYQPEPTVAPAKAAAIFKRKVHERLALYRKANGVGSFNPLAEATGNVVSADMLTRMLVGEKFPIDAWREVDKALDILEGKPSEE